MWLHLAINANLFIYSQNMNIPVQMEKYCSQILYYIFPFPFNFFKTTPTDSSSGGVLIDCFHDPQWTAYNLHRDAYDRHSMLYDTPEVAYDRLQFAYDRPEIAYDRPELLYDWLEIAYDRLETAYDKLQIVYDRVEVAYDTLLINISWDLYSVATTLQALSENKGTHYIRLVGVSIVLT